MLFLPYASSGFVPIDTMPAWLVGPPAKGGTSASTPARNRSVPLA